MSLISILVSWLIVSGGIWKLFERLESTASNKAKKNISKWLYSVDPRDKFSNIAKSVSVSFEQIYGRKFFSIEGFLNSTLVSYASVIFFILIWIGFRPEEFIATVSDKDFITKNLGFLSTIFLLNILPDYISLLETRGIIHLLKKNNSKLKWLILLIIDIVLTISIALFMWFIVVSKNQTDLYSFQRVWEDFIYKMLPLSNVGTNTLPIGAFFYSTFFTSVWIWLYALSILIIKSGSGLFEIIKKSRLIFNIEEKPFISLGAIAIMLITLLYIPVLLLFGLYQITG